MKAQEMGLGPKLFKNCLKAVATIREERRLKQIFALVKQVPMDRSQETISMPSSSTASRSSATSPLSVTDCLEEEADSVDDRLNNSVIDPQLLAPRSVLEVEDKMADLPRQTEEEAMQLNNQLESISESIDGLDIESSTIINPLRLNASPISARSTFIPTRVLGKTPSLRLLTAECVPFYILLPHSSEHTERTMYIPNSIVGNLLLWEGIR